MDPLIKACKIGNYKKFVDTYNKLEYRTEISINRLLQCINIAHKMGHMRIRPFIISKLFKIDRCNHWMEIEYGICMRHTTTKPEQIMRFCEIYTKTSIGSCNSLALELICRYLEHLELNKIPYGDTILHVLKVLAVKNDASYKYYELALLNGHHEILDYYDKLNDTDIGRYYIDYRREYRKKVIDGYNIVSPGVSNIIADYIGV